MLEELRPTLKASARRSLLKSMERVGQLSEILVTADDYILDGRTRLELAKELGCEPRIRRLMMHSGVGDMPPGYDRDWELEQVRDVIEETGRGKWRDGGARREEASSTSSTSSTSSNASPTSSAASSASSSSLAEAVARFICTSPSPVTRAEAEQHFNKQHTRLSYCISRLAKDNRIRIVDRGNPFLYHHP